MDVNGQLLLGLVFNRNSNQLSLHRWKCGNAWEWISCCKTFVEEPPRPKGTKEHAGRVCMHHGGCVQRWKWRTCWGMALLRPATEIMEICACGWNANYVAGAPPSKQKKSRHWGWAKKPEYCPNSWRLFISIGANLPYLHEICLGLVSICMLYLKQFSLKLSACGNSSILDIKLFQSMCWTKNIIMLDKRL